MSLSRPVKFPLLKLPWLCVKCVLHNTDLFDIIYFASISDRARRIVKLSKYPLKEIEISLNRCKRIWIGYMEGKREIRRNWYFIHHKEAFGEPLVLQRKSRPFVTSSGFDSKRGHYLESYTSDNTLNALKIGMNFMIDLFGCTIRKVFVDGNYLSELSGLDICSVKALLIRDPGPVSIIDLKYLLETISVTDRYVFDVPIPKEFSCDPQIFKCRHLFFGCENSADWVTLELLCQFDVSQLFFSYHRFSVEDIVSYVTHWFNSDNRKLEYLFVPFKNPVSLEDFEIDHLNPMPFCEKRRNRWTLNESWKNEDMSGGLDILRKDGLLATFQAYPSSICFYVWHKRFPDTV